MVCTTVWPKVGSVWPNVWTRVCPTVWTTVCIGSVLSGTWSAQRSCRLSGQRSGHGSVPSGHGSLLCGQWSVESLFSLANSGQSLFGLAKGGQSLYRLANTYLRVLLVRPKHVSGMVGLANDCFGSRTSSWELKWDKNITLREIYQLTTSFNSAYNKLQKASINQLNNKLQLRLRQASTSFI